MESIMGVCPKWMIRHVELDGAMEPVRMVSGSAGTPSECKAWRIRCSPPFPSSAGCYLVFNNHG